MIYINKRKEWKYNPQKRSPFRLKLYKDDNSCTKKHSLRESTHQAMYKNTNGVLKYVNRFGILVSKNTHTINTIESTICCSVLDGGESLN